MRALRDMNLPKFVFEDVPLFLGQISDLFPGLDCPRVRYPSFNDAVETILQENKYILLPNQVPYCGIMTIYGTGDCSGWFCLNNPCSVLLLTSGLIAKETH